MNKKVIALIALSSMLMTGLQLSAMEDPIFSRAETEAKAEMIKQYETQMHEIQDRIEKLTQSSEFYLQEQARGQGDGAVCLGLESTIGLIKEQRKLYQSFKKECERLRKLEQ